MKKEVLAKTFTPVYDEIEDRIRLAVNYQDAQNRVDFMITRNLILNLSPSADEFISKNYPDDSYKEESIVVNKKEDKKEGLSTTDSTNFELYRTSEELLQEVNLSFDKTTKNTILTLSSKNFTAKAALDESSVSKTFEIIKSAIPYIKWGISHNF